MVFYKLILAKYSHSIYLKMIADISLCTMTLFTENLLNLPLLGKQFWETNYKGKYPPSPPIQNAYDYYNHELISSTMISSMGTSLTAHYFIAMF